MTARFNAPIEIGGLKTADPLDPRVRSWWRAKADEIYRRIPDFGGFLVKANSEGQPGPQDYGRSHADGANMLADAVAPARRHRDVAGLRLFRRPAGRTARARPMTSSARSTASSASNVILQVKNGPIDFQPREPFHPLFGACRKTPLAMEAQITKEYLGFATHLAYLGTAVGGGARRRHLRADVAGSPVARDAAPAMAGVANVGTVRNWSGSHFDQANWYAFGRLAWNPRALVPRRSPRNGRA